MPKGFRSRKKPSKGLLERRVEELTEALEDIADILEDVGILEPPEIEEEHEYDPEEPEIIEHDPSNLVIDPKEEKPC